MRLQFHHHRLRRQHRIALRHRNHRRECIEVIDRLAARDGAERTEILAADRLRDEAYLAVAHDGEGSAFAVVLRAHERRDCADVELVVRDAAYRGAAACDPGSLIRWHLDQHDRLVEAVLDVGKFRDAVVAEDAAVLCFGWVFFVGAILGGVVADAGHADEMRGGQGVAIAG